MQQGGAVYILSSPNRGALYVGVTANLPSRIWEHRNKKYPDSFSAKYNCTLLVYYRLFDGFEEAIAEEKRIKGGSRAKKEALIHNMNPEWADLYESIL